MKQPLEAAPGWRPHRAGNRSPPRRPIPLLSSCAFPHKLTPLRAPATASASRSSPSLQASPTAAGGTICFPPPLQNPPSPFICPPTAGPRSSYRQLEQHICSSATSLAPSLHGFKLLSRWIHSREPVRSVLFSSLWWNRNYYVVPSVCAFRGEFMCSEA
jgi:hypothetical protein